MNLFVLSQIQPDDTRVGWIVNSTLEEVLASTCDPTFIAPQENSQIKLLRRYRHRLLRSWYHREELPTLGQGTNVLLAIGHGPNFLLSLFSLGSLLSRFDLRIGYLLDGFDPKYLDRAVIPYLDHLFVITAEIADRLNKQVPTHFLPLATDMLARGRIGLPRSIDIISYGRGRQDLHEHLQTHYNEANSDRLYFHTTYSGGVVENLQEHITLLSKLLDRSKVNLCFEPSYVGRFQGFSPILLRWFEGWASGCTIVGRRPFGQGVADLMDWENSTIELPENAADWIPFFEDLLGDEKAIAANAKRNHQESLLRHDWRYRLRDLFNLVELPIPEKLDCEIGHLKQKFDATKTL